MTLHQNVQQRAVMHNRRSKLSTFQKRGIIDPAKVIKPIDTAPPKPAATPPTKATPDPASSSSSATIEKSSSSTPSSASSSASTSSPSSVTSSSSPVTAPSTTPVLSTPSSLSTSARVKATSTPRVVASPAGSSGSSAIAAAASKHAADSTTSGLGTRSLIGIIGGSVVGLIVICIVVAFVLRRLRKSQNRADAFNSSQFRRSAVLLDEKDQQPDFRPRPPSMIERRNAQTSGARPSANDFPPPPSMAYPYSDQVPPSPATSTSMYGAGSGGSEHGHGQYPQYGSTNPQYGNFPPPPPPSQSGAYSDIPGAYGIPPPGAFGAHYEQAGYGAPPIPGTYAPGAYAPYGAPDPRYPHPQYRYQQQQQQGYPQHSNYQQRPAPHAEYGPRMDSLANSNSGASEKQTLRLASSQEESSPSRSLSTSSSTSSLTRQPTQSGGAPPAYMDDGEGAKMAARSDVKMKPVVLNAPMMGANTSLRSTAAPAMSTGTGTGTLREGTANANGARPLSATSAYLAYDQEDAYGGM